MFFDNMVTGLEGVPSFDVFCIKDKNPLSGVEKVRVMRKPNTAMRVVHERLKVYLAGLGIKLSYAAGCTKGDSPLKNVLRHKGNRYFCLFDIRNAFPSVDGQRLAGVLCQRDTQLVGKERDVLAFLRGYCLTREGGLVIGAPASPALFNLYAGTLLDPRLSFLCGEYGLTYSRYLDDLIFSAKEPIGKRKRKAILDAVTAAGFAVNHRKTVVRDLAKGSMVINGIGLDIKGRTFLPGRYLKKIRGLLHRAIAKGDVDPAKVEGVMGVFLAALPCSPFGAGKFFLNKTERKLLAEYERFRLLTWGH